MVGNQLSGHTNHNMTLSGTAQPVDGLADGDHITSPTLTNLLEGVQGNGIILEEDTAYSAGTRYQPENLPGICERTGANTFTVAGGNVIIDGLVYTFAGGFGSSTTYTITAAATEGNNTALTTGQEALVVVYACGNSATNHVKMEVGNAVLTGTNVYPVTPNAFLNNGGGVTDNLKSVVLCTLRVTFDAGGGDLKVNIAEVNDKRIFVRPTPIYFTPVVDGGVGATDAVDSHTDLDATMAGNAGGNFSASRLGGMWMSRGGQIGSTVAGDNTKDVLYFSGTHAARYSRSVFDRVLTSTATSIDLTSTDANVLVLTPGGSFTITTSGTFPAGYIIEIKNTHGSNTGTFALTNSTTSAIGDTADADGGYGKFVCTVSHATNPTFVRLL